jgi:hypothetical protein
MASEVEELKRRREVLLLKKRRAELLSQQAESSLTDLQRFESQAVFNQDEIAELEGGKDSPVAKKRLDLRNQYMREFRDRKDLSELDEDTRMQLNFMPKDAQADWLQENVPKGYKVRTLRDSDGDIESHLVFTPDDRLWKVSNHPKTIDIAGSVAGATRLAAEGAGGVLGAVAGLPAGHPIAGAMLGAGTVGAGFEAASQAMAPGSIDAGDIALSGAYAAGGELVGVLGGKAVAKVLGKSSHLKLKLESMDSAAKSLLRQTGSGVDKTVLGRNLTELQRQRLLAFDEEKVAQTNFDIARVLQFAEDQSFSAKNASDTVKLLRKANPKDRALLDLSKILTHKDNTIGRAREVMNLLHASKKPYAKDVEKALFQDLAELSQKTSGRTSQALKNAVSTYQNFNAAMEEVQNSHLNELIDVALGPGELAKKGFVRGGGGKALRRLEALDTPELAQVMGELRAHAPVETLRNVQTHFMREMFPSGAKKFTTEKMEIAQEVLGGGSVEFKALLEWRRLLEQPAKSEPGLLSKGAKLGADLAITAAAAHHGGALGVIAARTGLKSAGFILQKIAKTAPELIVHESTSPALYAALKALNQGNYKEGGKLLNLVAKRAAPLWEASAQELAGRGTSSKLREETTDE